MGLERFGKAEQNGPVDRFERQTPGAQAEGRAKTPAACYKSALTMSGCSSMVERQLPKLHTWVRFPSPAPRLSWLSTGSFAASFAVYVRVPITESWNSGFR